MNTISTWEAQTRELFNRVEQEMICPQKGVQLLGNFLAVCVIRERQPHPICVRGRR